MADAFKSSQAFVQALASSSDPPVPGGPSKFELVRDAWASPSVQLPNKADLIVEWILSRFLKAKSNTHPLLDIEHWNLLSNILSPSGQHRDTRPLKSWLLPILNRIPILPILITLLDRIRGDYQALTTVVEKCIHVLWPMCVPRFSLETLLDAFGSVLNTSARWEMDESLARIASRVTSSFLDSFRNSSNKKKLHVTFLRTCFKPWIECISKTHSSILVETHYTAGAEILFNTDSLRQPPDQLFVELSQLHDASQSCVLPVLPPLLRSYISASKKHRNSLYSGSDIDIMQQVRVAGMNFFVSCQQFLNISSSETWSSRASLLLIVEQENIFLPSDEGEVEEALSGNIKDAATAILTDDTEIKDSALEVISIMMRLSSKFISSAFSSIFPVLFLVSPSSSCFRFIDFVLDHHTKTRTLNTYISRFFSCLLSLQSCNYQVTSVSSPMLPLHLDHLMKRIDSFLPPGQALEVATGSLNYLDQLWFAADQEDGRPGKRRRKSQMQIIDAGQDLEEKVTKHSLCSRFAGIVLASLPLESLSAMIQDEIKQVILKAYRKSILELGLLENQRWHCQVVAAANLRLQYCLRAARKVRFPPMQDIDSVGKALVKMVGDEEILPELALEIFRILLSFIAEKEHTNPRLVIDGLTDYLQKHLDASVSWSGRYSHLALDEKGKAKCALALYSMVTERWLPVINQLASQEQLAVLVRPMLWSSARSPSEVEPAALVQLSAIATRTLRSAQFWELPNFRSTLISMLEEETAQLDFLDLRNILVRKAIAHAGIEKVDRALPSYWVLQYVPIEYLNRSSRVNLVRRAMICDAVLGASGDVTHMISKVHYLRVFMKMAGDWIGDVVVPEFVEHLISQDIPSPLPDFLDVTLHVIKCQFRRLVKASPHELLPIFTSFARLDLSSDFDGERGEIQRRSSICLTEVLIRDATFSSFSEGVQRSLLDLHCLLSASVSREVPSALPSYNIKGQISLLQIWRQLLTFGRWLGLNNSGLPKFGDHVSTLLPSSPNIDPNSLDFSAAVLSLLLEELYDPRVNHLRHLDLIVGSYLVLSRTGETNGEARLDRQWFSVCKDLSLPEFSHGLELTVEALSSPHGDSKKDLACLIHLSVVLTHNAPEGALKVIQGHTNRILNLFVNRSTFIVGPMKLRLQALEFVLQLCSDRPTSLRIQDHDRIWSLLGKFLQKSTYHDLETSSVIFNSLVEIMSALIRLRRDLVVHTLPHLSHVLRQLLFALRNLRPQLGGKQSKLVTDSLPLWVNVMARPLGAEEARVLARLLSALTVKTIPRFHRHNVSASEPPKAESLAKPFSKHAAHVLTSYIEATNDPLCVLPLELKKELQPGLFSLCDMLGDRDRDAMMVSALDADGIMTMKTLWRDYDRQKYAGKD